jgi:hypothetical protein
VVAPLSPHVQGLTEVSTVAEMVDFIDNQNGKAYTWDGFSRADIHTVHPAHRRPYSQTTADGQVDEQLAGTLSGQLENLMHPDDGRRIEPEPHEALVLLRSSKWADVFHQMSVEPDSRWGQ